MKSSQKIASGTNGGPTLANFDCLRRSRCRRWVISTATAVTELAVGAFRDDTGGNGRGAVHILFLNANGTVKSSQKIASGTGGGPGTADQDYFGRSVAALAIWMATA